MSGFSGCFIAINVCHIRHRVKSRACGTNDHITNATAALASFAKATAHARARSATSLKGFCRASGAQKAEEGWRIENLLVTDYIVCCCSDEEMVYRGLDFQYTNGNKVAHSFA